MPFIVIIIIDASMHQKILINNSSVEALTSAIFFVTLNTGTMFIHTHTHIATVFLS